MHKKYLVFIVAFIFIALGGAYGYMRYSQYNNTTYVSDAKAAYATFLSEDYERSIKEISAVLEKAPNKSEQGRLKIVLAVSYWARNEGDDRTQAIKKLKEVVNDYSIPPVWRAQALNSIARFVNDSGLSFYRVHFTEAPYSTFLPSEGSDVEKMNAIYMALLKYSDDTYPTSWAEYALANHYALLNTTNSNLTKNLSNKDIALLIKKYVEDGDSRKDEEIYSPTILMQGHLYKALSLTRATYLLNNDETIPSVQVENAFSRILQEGAQLKKENKPFSASSVVQARFFYANFVTRFPGREKDVDTILRGYADMVADSQTKEAVFNYFNFVDRAPEGDFRKNVAIKLRDISPYFKELLKDLNITLS